MPEVRRTRAMGFSPGGPQELDLNAPTRQSRKAKAPAPAQAAPQDAPVPVARTTRARSGAKRKNDEDVTAEPPAKKSRRNENAEESEAVASDPQALATLPDSESENLLEGASSSQEQGNALESAQAVAPAQAVEAAQAVEPRINAQQPTPPLDTPGDGSAIRSITKAPQASLQDDASLTNAQKRADRKTKNDKRISDMIRSYQTMRDEEEEEAKALSECDDEEWEERYSTVMEQARNPTPFIATSKGDWEKWVPGSTGMFVVREPSKKDIAAANKGGPCMPPSNYNPGFIATASRLAAMGARPLTNINTIVAVSASLDWYEKNPSVAAPTATEMAAMLDNFARAKQAQQTEPANPVRTQVLQKAISDGPLTPNAQVASENWVEGPHSAEPDDGQSNTNNPEEAGMKQDADMTDIDQNRSEATEPQTPQPQHGLQGPRTWSSALSASAIGIFTPLNNWFTRRNRNRRDIAATEPRPVRIEPEVTRSAHAHEKPRSREAPAQSSKKLPAKKNFVLELKATQAPDSPTPTAPQPRRGRPDSHLPVHLRGVLFEDLPAEWQAVSEHLKKPKQVEVDDEEDEPVDMEYLLATAKRTRKERERKELQEQAELIAQKQRDLESDDEFSGDQVDRKGKKRVTFSLEKTYSAKLGHSTFGMPANIDESSSEEDPGFLGPQTHFGRNSRPKKSCLKRSYQQPTFGDYNGDGDGQDRYEPRPAKKVRLDDLASSQSSELLEDNDDIALPGEHCESFLYNDDPHRARPFSRFISKPPSELRAAEEAQLEFDRLNPRKNALGDTPRVLRKLGPQKYDSNRSNVFTSRVSNTMEDWSKGFRIQDPLARAARLGMLTPRPYAASSRLRQPFPSPRYENGRLTQNTAHLNESSQARLNKKREDAMKHKPETSSSLQVARTLSPISDKPSWKNAVLDEEVLNSIALLDDDDIVAEGFGDYPDHAEATVSREASKALDNTPETSVEIAAGEREVPKAIGYVQETWFDKAAREREALKTIDNVQETWFDKAARERKAKIQEAAKTSEVVEVEEEL